MSHDVPQISEDGLFEFHSQQFGPMVIIQLLGVYKDNIADRLMQKVVISNMHQEVQVKGKYLNKTRFDILFKNYPCIYAMICQLHILLPTELHLKNVYYLYSASLNPTDVVQVIVLVIACVITHRSNLAVPISSTLAYNHIQENHLDNISGIRTRAVEIVNVFEMEFRW